MRLNDHANTAADYRRAKELRNNSSPVERRLWAVLRVNGAARGLNFRRQHVVHPYIADFACLQARLLVEIDGASHEGRVAYDKVRETFLRGAGYYVLRFGNDEVIKNVEGVVVAILALAEKLVQENVGDNKTCHPHTLMLLPVPESICEEKKTSAVHEFDNCEKPDA